MHRSSHVSQQLFIRLRENRDEKDFQRPLSPPWQGNIYASHPSPSIFQHKTTTCNLLFLFQDRISLLHIYDCVHVILKKLYEHSEDTYTNAAGRRITCQQRDSERWICSQKKNGNSVKPERQSHLKKQTSWGRTRHRKIKNKRREKLSEQAVQQLHFKVLLSSV